MYTIKLSNEPLNIEKLPFGGSKPDGTTVGVNSVYFEKNGQPWIPVTGEFQFSRYPEKEWEKALLKMKAGGIEIVATYIFWIHHEEEKGVWDFTGCRNLRKFTQLCEKHGLSLILRCGPWAHGECRNGGFPDWLQHEKNFELRTNSPEYLALVDTYFRKIYEQVDGYLWKDNGPVIGMQIENEYGPCGGPDNVDEGRAHMHTLKELALAIGFDVPFYTATVWGGGIMVENETLPVEAAYVDAPWSSSLEELPPSMHLLLQLAVNDPSIGSDLKKDVDNNEYTIDVNRYPYATAELGGGVQSTHHRRMFIEKKDTEALAFCKLGSGANLIGYYVYHGGTNPEGKLSTLNESKLSGNPHECPIKCYDFEAPLGESGRAKGSYGGLKKLHLFLDEFSNILADTKVVITEENATDPEDYETLRFCVRHNPKTKGGFLFINNYVRKRQLQEHTDAKFILEMEEKKLELPTLQIKDGDMKIIPYHMMLGDALLLTTNAQPLTKVGNRYFFICDDEPVYCFQDVEAPITTLSVDEADHSYVFGDKLYVSEQDLFEQDGVVYAESNQDQISVMVYDESGEKSEIQISSEKNKTKCIIKDCKNHEGYQTYHVEVEYDTEVEDVLLNFHYLGDKIEVYMDEKLIGDYFTSGRDYCLPLKRHGYPEKLEVKVYPTEDNVYYDVPVEAGMELKEVVVEPLYLFKIQ